jgi:hypothetical protein
MGVDRPDSETGTPEGVPHAAQYKTHGTKKALHVNVDAYLRPSVSGCQTVSLILQE